MSAPALVKCSKCGALMMPHRVCKKCGASLDKAFVKKSKKSAEEVKEEAPKKRTRKRSAKSAEVETAPESENKD